MVESVGFWSRWNRFWFQPTHPIAMDGFRIAFCLMALVWLGSYWGYEAEMFSMEGWMDRATYQEIQRLNEDDRPFLGWSPMYLLRSTWAARFAYWTSLAAVVAFLWGFASRITGILTWLAIITFTSNPLISYNGDMFLVIFSFYLMLGYFFAGIGQADGLLALNNSDLGSLLNPEDQARRHPSFVANWTIRCLQVHLAIAISLAGLFKFQVGEWWAGDALWFPLFPPDTTPISRVQELIDNRATGHAFILSLLAYLMLAWQISFAFVAWNPSFRWWIVGGGVVAFLGNVFLYQLPLFGPAYLLATLLFIPSDYWLKVFAWRSRLSPPQES